MYALPGVSKLLQKLDVIESLGCSCDALYGYGCEIHKEVQDLRKQIEDVQKNFAHSSTD